MAVWCWEAACNKHCTQFFLSQKEISLCDQEMVWICRLWDSLLHSLMYILMAHWRDGKRWHLSCQSQEKMVRPMLCERNIWRISYWWNHWHWSTVMDKVENVCLSSVHICVVRKSEWHPCLEISSRLHLDESDLQAVVWGCANWWCKVPFIWSPIQHSHANGVCDAHF